MKGWKERMYWAMKRRSKGFINRTYHRLFPSTKPSQKTRSSVRDSPRPACLTRAQDKQVEIAKWTTPEVLVHNEDKIIPPAPVIPVVKKDE
jgi:hypothetical protein